MLRPRRRPTRPKRRRASCFFIIIAAGADWRLASAAGCALKPKPEAGTAARREAGGATSPAAPIYYKYDPAFVVNFGGEGSARYLQVMVEAMTRDPAVLEIAQEQ